VEQIANAISRGPGIAVLDVTMDADHNRSVITFAGSPDSVVQAAIRAVGKAAELIDLNTHTGVHPRIGATDVLPFVPIAGMTMEECSALAVAAGNEIWDQLNIPVYLYEHAARVPERTRLENIRRGGFEELCELSLIDEQRHPDIGGPGLHPTAGATVVGAREFLIAYNINLATADLSVAKRIAHRIRESTGGFSHVKALGLPLATRKQSQVSMNLTDFRVTPLHAVYDAVLALADAEGVPIAGSEIIGLIPKAALEMAAAHYIQCENFAPQLVLENRLEEALPFTLDDVLEQISDPQRALGGGSAAALAGALAASLGILTARLLKSDPKRFEDHRGFYRAAMNRDAEAFAAFISSAQSNMDALVEATEAPLTIAERSVALVSDLAGLEALTPDRYRSDITTAQGLAIAARGGALATAELNLARIEDQATRDALAVRVAKLK
jgi:glutamate formiminotransferase